jgi:hypothetical protein
MLVALSTPSAPSTSADKSAEAVRGLLRWGNLTRRGPRILEDAGDGSRAVKMTAPKIRRNKKQERVERSRMTERGRERLFGFVGYWLRNQIISTALFLYTFMERLATTGRYLISTAAIFSASI